MRIGKLCWCGDTTGFVRNLSTSLLMSLALVVAGAASVQAQTDPNLENGFKPYGTYSGSNVDSVNLMNGNLMLHIPMPFGLPQRGKVQPSYFLGITSKLWLKTCAGSSCQWYPGSFREDQPPLPLFKGLGFDNSLDMAVMRTTHTFEDTLDSGLNVYAEGVTALATADGATHKLAGITTDLTGYQVVESNPDAHGINQTVVIRDRGGNLYATGGYQDLLCKVSTQQYPDPNNPGQYGWKTTTDCTQAARVTGVTDTNGNQTTFDGQDTFGRAVSMEGYSGTQTTTDYSGCVSPPSQPVSTATISNYTGFNGVTNQVKVCYSNITLSTSFGVTGTAESTGGQQQVIVSVVFLADGSTWSFQYNSYGDVTYVGLPLGGSIQYQWQTHAFPNCPAGNPTAPVNVSRAVTQRTVTDSNGNSYVWNYQYGTASCGSALVNTMTDPLGNDTVNVFTQLQSVHNGVNENPAPFFVTTTKVFQGSQNSGTLLKQEDFQYYSNGQAGDYNVANGFVTKITTTINGKVSQVTRTPDAGPNGSAHPNFGLVMVEKKYDFGPGGPGPLLRETDTSYTWQGTSSTAQQYLAANIIGLPSSIQIKDVNGNVCAETDNGYDDSSRLTAYVGTIPNHGAPPNAVRGNLTSISRKVSAAACSVSSSTPSLTSYINWYDTGQVYQQIDPLGNVTATHTYDLAYDGAYSTKSCNAKGQCVSGTYDFSTGLLTSFTNANATQQASGTTPGDSAHTSFYAYDALSRMTQATFPPDSGNNNAQAVTQFSYPMPLSLPFTVTRSKSVTAGQMDSVTSTFDGLGRAFKTVHTTAGNATVVTQYDGLDHVISVTNPYFSTSDPTYGAIQSQYDALGRVTQVTAQDGGISITDYSNFPTVTVTDPAGKKRRSRADALGRLVEVDEPGPGANTAGTPGTGTITISGSLAGQTNPGTRATGWFSVGGGEEYVWNCGDGGLCNPKYAIKTWDSGQVSLTVNGVTAYAGYGQGSTRVDLASSLAGPLSPHPTTFSDPGTGTITITADVPGPNYSLSGTAHSDDPADFGSGSFAVSVSGPTLTGGVYPSTTYDSGTVTVTVNGFQASASYSQNVNNTAQWMASSLASALNAANSPVSAVASGTTITITAKSVGTATNYSVSGSSTASFSASSTTLSGGTNPGGLYTPYVTNYSYDTLGNLAQVNQLGDGTQAARVRSFSYDTLSRLLTSQNPEAGAISYSYDADGNMLQKTSPAPNALPGSTATQTISYCYDQLNRVTGKAYSAQSCTNGLLPAGTAVVSYLYDAGGQAANAIGRLTSLTDQAGSASYAYNILGRMTSESRTTLGTTNISNTIGYSYQLDGSLKTLTYPSGAVISYTPDAAGRDVSAVDSSGATPINYVTGATFGADDAITGFINGSGSGFAGITNSFSFNKRLQPVFMSASSPSQTVFSVGYDFHLGNGDNGSVFAITNNRDHSRDQTFTYDQLNRLASAQNAGTTCNQMTANNKNEYWGNSYGYDAWGNLLSKTVTKCGAENLSVSVTANNQLQGGYTYDIAGNMLHDATANLNYTYDQESRISTAGGYTYTYDAGGNRAKKSNGSTGTIYWYSAVGVIAESDLSGNMQHEYVFFGGKRVARKDLPGKAVSYYFSDHLQRASVVTDSAGNIKADSDYYPFGSELQIVNNDSNDYKFTGKKRDVETGLDYFGARYYSSGFSRFVTPDWSSGPATVPYAHLDNPQTLNLYSYVDNNPVNAIDVDGHSRQQYMLAGPRDWGENSGIAFEGKRSLEDFSPLPDQAPPGGLPQSAQPLIGQVPGPPDSLPSELFCCLPGPPTLAPQAPTLTVTKVAGCGAADTFCNTLFKLDSPSDAGGWIIQQIDRNNAALKPYWEAWDVKRGKQYTDYAEQQGLAEHPGLVADDFWSSRNVTADARFYEGLKLPDTFQVGNVPEAGSRPSTYDDPSRFLPLDHASNVVHRTFP